MDDIEGYFFVYLPTEGILLDVTGSEVENGRRRGKFRPQTIAIQKEL